MENKNQSNLTTVVVIVTILILFGGFGVFSWLKYDRAASELAELKSQQMQTQSQLESLESKTTENQPQQAIGGQTDEHGCLSGAGYAWCSSAGKCQRMWEEYCEEYKDQYQGGGEGIIGDAGENPPAESVNWNVYKSAAHDFSFKYPDKYKIVEDNYGWPHAVVHLIDKAGGQSYDITFETWDDENDAKDEGRMSSVIPYFGMMENPNTNEFVSMTCWNKVTADDCEGIYLTLSFQ